MRRELTCTEELHGDAHVLAAAFATDPAHWLPAPARRRGTRSWSVALSASGVSRPVECRVGPPWRVGEGLWRSVTWTPLGHRHEALPVERALPTLTGELGIVDGVPCRLWLRASYTPPAGIVGAMADAVVLHRVAQATAEHFLAEIADRLAPGRVDEGPGRGRTMVPHA